MTTVRLAQPNRDAKELRAQKERSKFVDRPISNMFWIGAGFFVTGEAACERAKECTYAYMTEVSEQPT